MKLIFIISLCLGLSLAKKVKVNPFNETEYKEVKLNAKQQKYISDIDGQLPDSDPCSKINQTSNVYQYNDIMSCYKSFPFQPKLRDEILDTLWKILPFYAYTDVARKRSVDVIKSEETLDIESLLSAVRNKVYETDFEFQMELVNLFTELRDGHTKYMPLCYQGYEFHLPFPLIIIKSSNSSQGLMVKVKGGAPYSQVELDIWKGMGINVVDYNDATVLKINGKNPLKALSHIADTRYGTSRDPHSRMNGALAGIKLNNGQWTLEFGEFASTKFPPENEYVTFEFLVDGKKKIIKTPYLGTLVQSEKFSSATDYFKNICLAKKVDLLAKAKQMEDEDRIKKEQEKNGRVKRAKKNFKVNDNHHQDSTSLVKPLYNVNKVKRVVKKIIEDYEELDISNPLVDGKYTKFYLFNKDIGVAVLPTFHPDDTEQFTNEVIKGFKQIKKKGAKKLILDVSNNGGGYVCFGYSILSYLLPKDKFKHFRLDMHMNPLLTSLMLKDDYKGSPFNIKERLRPNGTAYDSFEELMPKGEERKDVENRYTNFFVNDCKEEDFMSGLRDKLNGNLPYPLKDISVISNSYCYSTCGLFVNTLQELANVDTYAIGGTVLRNGRLPTAGSMNGANVFSVDNLQMVLAINNLTSHPLYPQQFPVNVSMSITLMQAYSHFPDSEGNPIPLEFLARTTDKHYYYTNETVDRPDAIWKQMASDRGYIKKDINAESILGKVGSFFSKLFAMSPVYERL